MATRTSSGIELTLHRGEDNEIGEDDGTQRDIRDQARRRCMQSLQSGLSGSRAWTQRDSREFLSENLSDRALSLVGIVNHEEQLRAILENESQHIPEIINKLRQMEPQFRAQIAEAESKGWISAKSASGWIDRLEDQSAPWWKKSQFLTEKFPEYRRNWQKLHDDMETVKKKCEKKGTNPKDTPEVAVLFAHGFNDATFTFKRGALDKALASLAATNSNRKELYNKAKQMLNQAVYDDALSKAKIGTWLRRIFESEADPKKIEEFINGSGNTSLSVFIWRWRQASLDFDKLDSRSKKEGKPPSFTFISKKKFLDMHYESRMSYLQEAEYRMKDKQLASMHPLILDIRREIEAKDGASAEYLTRQAYKKALPPADLQKLTSLEQYLKTQKSEHGNKSHTENVDPKIEMEMLLSQVPAIVQPLFRSAMERGEKVTRALKSLWYNRVWCRQHGHLDDQKEEILRQRSEADTQKVLKEGQGRGYANINTRHGRPVVRNYQRREWSPQVLHYTKDMHESLTEDITTGKDNYAFKYWTTLVPKGVDYETHSYVLRDLFPKIMNCVRRLDAQKQGKAAA